ncbi:50S ribosomal subunit protein L16 [Candidatus Hodgkinia cicadicola]|uniref:50S ribosomal protein L16 n=1 Tax=Candidatus Hodgkinia cicadicola TaxID=573658 RepID=A0ABX4MFA2_9HYPH|nr:50S ribosomal subunit protein L16 [Candidatus Hodgkinia cicadicola]PIM96728.1 50S ribosomal subunit protein L16 [Candidatus Hodgkinia cicadicola]PIM96911.1 50S ribosomal subunit protein L16 [Candidatus Hodgkinia cicadicola]
MILKPKATKYKKQFRGHYKIKSKSGCFIEYGTYGLRATSSGRINGVQIESARVAISKFIKKVGKLWIRVFPNIPITKKPIEVRMGKGKGEVCDWIFKVGIGRIIFEIQGTSEEIARTALKAASYKLGIDTSFAYRIMDLTC